MDGLRKMGEKLESAVGLPHSPRASAKSKGAAGAPDWATSEHYPAPTVQPRVYPDDAAPPPQVERSASSKHRIDLNKMSPRAQAIVQEVGHELEESTRVIT
ncbi:hypothetical protein ABPG77_002935 [Micractinium sp. CCAP 211/92]